MIGDLAQTHGHSETGLPAKKKSSGCAPVILLCIGIGIGGLGADVQMKELGWKFMFETEGVDAHGC